MRQIFHVTSLLVLLMLLNAPASARTSDAVHYTLPQVYSGALRYLRIDLGCEITEKDPDTAYLLFRYQAPGKSETSFGAIEIVQAKQGVRLVIKLPQLPSYHETVLRDGLVRKLQEDYGSSEPKRDGHAKRDRSRDSEHDSKEPGKSSKPSEDGAKSKKSPDSAEN